MKTFDSSVAVARERAPVPKWGWLPWLRPLRRAGLRQRQLRHDGDAAEAGPKVGLALSSGGAKGLAHIGVIQVLEENGIEIEAVSGASMGAYVGAMWAAGLDGGELEELAADIRSKRDVWSLVDPVLWPRRGFVRGRKVEKRLRRTLGHRTFDELDRKLYVMATEFESFGRVVLSEGDVASAVLASVAVPGIVMPVEREGGFYLDGGICDPLPVSVLRVEAGVDVVVVVNVLPSAEEFYVGRRELPGCETRPLWRRPLCWLNRQVNWFAHGNILDTLRCAAMVAQMRVVEHSTSGADVIIRPVDRGAHWHDYRSFRRYIAIGRQAAEAALPALREALDERRAAAAAGGGGGAIAG